MNTVVLNSLTVKLRTNLIFFLCFSLMTLLALGVEFNENLNLCCLLDDFLEKGKGMELINM